MTRRARALAEERAAWERGTRGTPRRTGIYTGPETARPIHQEADNGLRLIAAIRRRVRREAFALSLATIEPGGVLWWRREITDRANAIDLGESHSVSDFS